MSNETDNQLDNIIAKSGFFAGMNATMGILSMVMILAFVVFTISDVEYAAGVFATGKDFIIGTL
ncbi:MAG: BCCT family transporter, partial [Gammaproteobacteria bacterium]|nr:BCCT family transporter [Gammaproteobacteria bacterium]